jgi:hypothetical protein
MEGTKSRTIGPSRALEPIIAALTIMLAGCAGSVTPDPIDAAPSPMGAPAPQPVSVQMLEASPELKSMRFSDLLNFESPSDTVFVSPAGVRTRVDTPVAHTGRSSLRISGSSGKFTVKLASLLSDPAKFPGDWALAGAYFRSTGPAQVLVSCEIGGVVYARSATTLQPEKWTAALVDLANPVDPSITPSGAPSLTFTIDSPGGADLWCDDVLLIDNTRWIVGRAESIAQGKWTVSRRGMNYICGVPNEFTIRLMPAEIQPDGWKLDEANVFRACFSSTGRNKTLTIFPDGRSYWDGAFRPLSGELKSDSTWQDQQTSPAQVEIPETMGRLERRTPGDENNDGYNEARACYMILAVGPRLEMTITPRSVPVSKPMLEIKGMPPGEALVTVEGHLLERTLRLPDDTLLVEIPGKIDRPTAVNVRIQ